MSIITALLCIYQINKVLNHMNEFDALILQLTNSLNGELMELKYGAVIHDQAKAANSANE
jgi:hypothetical protein